MSKWQNYETNELKDIYSDYHKDVHGYRPRRNRLTHSEVVEAMTRLDDYLIAMKSTEQGRAQLAEDGWIV